MFKIELMDLKDNASEIEQQKSKEVGFANEEEKLKIRKEFLSLSEEFKNNIKGCQRIEESYFKFKKTGNKNIDYFLGLELHHIIPVHHGGKNTLENLIYIPRYIHHRIKSFELAYNRHEIRLMLEHFNAILEKTDNVSLLTLEEELLNNEASIEANIKRNKESYSGKDNGLCDIRLSRETLKLDLEKLTSRWLEKKGSLSVNYYVKAFRMILSHNKYFGDKTKLRGQFKADETFYYNIEGVKFLKDKEGELKMYLDKEIFLNNGMKGASFYNKRFKTNVFVDGNHHIYKFDNNKNIQTLIKMIKSK